MRRVHKRPPLPPEELAFRADTHAAFGAAILPVITRAVSSHLKTPDEIRSANEKDLARTRRQYERAVKDQKNRIPFRTKIALGVTALTLVGLKTEMLTHQPPSEDLMTTMVAATSIRYAFGSFHYIKRSAPERAAAARRLAIFQVNPMNHAYNGGAETTPLVPSWLVDTLDDQKKATLFQEIILYGSDAQREHVIDLELADLAKPPTHPESTN